MAKRKITPVEIALAVSQPGAVTQKEPDKFQAVKIIPRNGKQYALVVTYRTISLTTVRVITAFLTSKIKKYLI